MNSLRTREGGEGELDGRKIFFRDSSSLFRNYDLKRRKEKNVTQNYARRWRERKKEKKNCKMKCRVNATLEDNGLKGNIQLGRG